MADSTKDYVFVLNGLIQQNKDAEEGFHYGAEKCDDTRIRGILNEYSRQRAQFASDLQIEVARIGGEPEKSGSTGGAIHRGWMGFKTALTNHDDHAILAEAERGEDAIVRAYQDALGKELPADLRAIVQQQYHKIEQAHSEIRSLRDSADPDKNPSLAQDHELTRH